MILLGLDLGPHWAFIVSAYALALAVIAGLLAWVAIDRRMLADALRDLDARGVRRRSDQR